MFKHLIIAVLTVSSVQGAQLLKGKQVYTPGRLGDVRLTHDYTGFKVNDQLVYPQNMDKALRSADAIKLKALLNNGYITVDQSADGQYKLSHHGRLNGGGVGGATAGAWIGRFIGQAIGYGIVAIVCIPAAAGGPGAYAAACGVMGSTVAPIVESASHVTAIGGGIIGGLVSGPA
jgi:hypothetical protein